MVPKPGALNTFAFSEPVPVMPKPKAPAKIVAPISSSASASSASSVSSSVSDWTCAICDTENSNQFSRKCNVCKCERKDMPLNSVTTCPPLSSAHQNLANAFFRNNGQSSASPYTPTEPSFSSQEASPAASNESSFNDVTFNVTPMTASRKRLPDFASPDVMRYEKRTITRDSILPSPASADAGWRCITCDWMNTKDANVCSLCLDEK